MRLSTVKRTLHERKAFRQTLLVCSIEMLPCMRSKLTARGGPAHSAPSFSMDAAEQALKEMVPLLCVLREDSGFLGASMRVEEKRNSLILELARRDVKIASLE
eukprot:5785931-Amphidinium_carterae.1